MKIVQINSVANKGSTGKICRAISEIMNGEKIENYILYTAGKSDRAQDIKVADEKYTRMQALKSRVFGNYGFNSGKTTRIMINELEKIKPDIVHLHNIHGHDCNLTTLFSWFRENKTKVIWTFHDCWAFTGYCPNFDMAGCEKWETGCEKCVQRKCYSWFFDRSKTLYDRKKALFEGTDLTVVTPSEWLAEKVRKSFLKNFPVTVINNGIDLETFSFTPSDFRQKYNIPEDKKIILGVSMFWDERKGIDVFLKLAKSLGKKYQTVLVGSVPAGISLPTEIISIKRTENQKGLAKIYSAADVFLNPTREDNFPTVNIEALACSVPVVTFKVGGSPEILDKTCGTAVEKDDIAALEKETVRVLEDKPYSREACRARAENFSKDKKLREYITLYKKTVG